MRFRTLAFAAVAALAVPAFAMFTITTAGAGQGVEAEHQIGGLINTTAIDHGYTVATGNCPPATYQADTGTDTAQTHQVANDQGTFGADVGSTAATTQIGTWRGASGFELGETAVGSQTSG